ncbi:hypothetical protein TWF696_007976 [Orbilia brochopaga]|uniref:Uncharacterized protein n=1 Tax=Orbilia brochopaga TaxID=3140254 RepID=A0AAV9ULU9_9PEZI
MKLSTFFIAPLLIAVSSAAVLAPQAKFNAKIQPLNLSRRAAAPDPEELHVKDLLLETPHFKQLPKETIEFIKTVPTNLFDAMVTLSTEDFVAALGELANGRIPKIPVATGTAAAAPAATSKA